MINDYYLSKARDFADTEQAIIELAREKSNILNSIKNDKNIEHFFPNKDDVEKLSASSTLIKIEFTLKKPYICKDEETFTLIHLFTIDKKYKNNLKNNDNKLRNVFKDHKHNLPKSYTIYKKDDYWILQIKSETEYLIIEEEDNLFIYDGRITENPIVRDRFTGLPMVKPSTWKGHLRFAAGMVEDADFKNKEEIIRRLFGSASGDDDGTKGRLYFYPTFFTDEPKKDVITPLKRDTRTPSKGPISLEVMDNAKGNFHLLYFPYPKGEDHDEKQVDEDLKFLAESLRMMFYTYGFSAKKSSGFGVVEKLEEGEVQVFCNGMDRKVLFSDLYFFESDSGEGVGK